MNESFGEIVRKEEAKRQRKLSPQAQWQQLQNAVAWAELQATGKRNTKEACLAHQRELLARFAAANNLRSGAF